MGHESAGGHQFQRPARRLRVGCGEPGAGRHQRRTGTSSSATSIADRTVRVSVATGGAQSGCRLGLRRRSAPTAASSPSSRCVDTSRPGHHAIPADAGLHPRSRRRRQWRVRRSGRHRDDARERARGPAASPIAYVDACASAPTAASCCSRARPRNLDPRQSGSLHPPLPARSSVRPDDGDRSRRGRRRRRARGVYIRSADMSDDGRYVTYLSMSIDIDGFEGLGPAQVFRFDAAAEPGARLTRLDAAGRHDGTWPRLELLRRPSAGTAATSPSPQWRPILPAAAAPNRRRRTASSSATWPTGRSPAST